MTRTRRALVLALVCALAMTAAQVHAATPASASHAARSTDASGARASALAAARAHFEAGEFEQAFTRIIALADAGDAQALHLVGRVHLQPAYANFDPHEAARLLQIAADKGYAPAQHDLAELLRRGLGLPRDALLAFRWHLSAAEQSYRLSELAIADMYARGEGVAVNQQQASVWRARARRARKPAAKPATMAPAPARAPVKTAAPVTADTRRAKDREPPRAGNAQRHGHHIALGAYGTAEAARAQRELLRKELRRISPSVHLGITEIDRGAGRGTLHRLRTQDMELANARFLCDKLKKLLPQRGCFIVSGEPSTANTSPPVRTGARQPPEREPQRVAGPVTGQQPDNAQRFGHHIQLGAYGTAQAARRQREVLSTQLRRISPNVRLGITNVDRGDGRGMLHRLHTQDMDLGSARFLCNKLKKLLPQRGCFIVSDEP